MADEYWFKPKAYGYGATPISWKGWAATLGFFVFVVGFTFAMFGWPSSGSPPPATSTLLVWVFVLCVGMAAFSLFCRNKTDGEWRWRWGEKDKAGKS